MNTPELQAFVKQDTSEIFKNPMFRKFAHTVTDLAGSFDVIRQGGAVHSKAELLKVGLKASPLNVHKHISNELTNIEINQLMKHYGIKQYHGCFIKDRLPMKLKNGFYVINLNGNSHWVGLCKDKTKYYYFDSYGFIAPAEVEHRISKEYIWSDKDIQTMASSACGFYVTAWIRYLYHSHNKMNAYREFINQFKVNKKSNEKVLSSLL
jgi:hypothetical protein